MQEVSTRNIAQNFCDYKTKHKYNTQNDKSSNPTKLPSSKWQASISVVPSSGRRYSASLQPQISVEHISAGHLQKTFRFQVQISSKILLLLVAKQPQNSLLTQPEQPSRWQMNTQNRMKTTDKQVHVTSSLSDMPWSMDNDLLKLFNRLIASLVINSHLRFVILMTDRWRVKHCIVIIINHPIKID